MAHDLSGHESLQGDTYFGGFAPQAPALEGELNEPQLKPYTELDKPQLRNESLEIEKELFKLANGDQKTNRNTEFLPTPTPADTEVYGAKPYPVDAPRRVLMSPTPAPTPSPDSIRLKPRDPGQPGMH